MTQIDAGPRGHGPLSGKPLDSVERVVAALFVLAVGLLPWGGLLPVRAIHPKAQWPDLALAAAALAWMLWRLRAGLRLRAWHAALAAFLLMVGVSFLANRGRPDVDAGKVAGHLLLAGWAVVGADAGRRVRVVRAVAVVTAATIGLLALFLAASLAWPEASLLSRMAGSFGDLQPGGYLRFQGGFTHPNQLASYLLLAWALLVAGRRERDDRKVAWLWGARAMLAVILLFTFSRAIIVLPVVVTWGARRAALRRLRWPAVALAVTALAALTVLNVRLLPTRPWDAGLDEDASPRHQALVTSLAAIAETPWTGSGPGRHPGTVQGMPFDAHCTPVNLAATLGIPALAAAWAFVMLIRRGRGDVLRSSSSFASDGPGRCDFDDRLLWAALLGMGIDGLAQDVEDYRHVWLALGLAAGTAEHTAPR